MCSNVIKFCAGPGLLVECVSAQAHSLRRHDLEYGEWGAQKNAHVFGDQGLPRKLQVGKRALWEKSLHEMRMPTSITNGFQRVVASVLHIAPCYQPWTSAWHFASMVIARRRQIPSPCRYPTKVPKQALTVPAAAVAVSPPGQVYCSTCQACSERRGHT